ncbi:helix-turn-helix domain-containing protein [Paenibacillus sp. J5C_2022]|uniref:helix-turn-helix domain-containing protein n=1 Tax=Paenibacillus sp. J5C2022 TaxID=2977129 RepID=UPI0021D29829|nr:helix-turn-helix transcriptional regulator [Paenibacillus sp. J5C2022]MCU6709424.1 helix-turn-helix domain-containing protein [Paenibacillus sp. J5C2022]
MIGLEFITQVYGKNFSEVASELNISRQTMNDWIKGRKNIPKKRLEQLKKQFPNIPTEYFQKSLTKSEQIKIQEIFFTETDEYEVIEYQDIDDDGNEYTRTQTVSQYEGLIYHLRNEHEKQALLERCKRLLDDEGENAYFSEKMIEKYMSILESNNGKKIELLRMVFHFLTDEKEFAFGSDPFFSASDNKIAIYTEFENFIRKHKFID